MLYNEKVTKMKRLTVILTHTLANGGARISQRYSAGLRAGWSGFSSPGRVYKFISSPPCPNRLWVPPSLLSNGYEGLFPWVWSYTSTPQYAFMECSVKAQRQLYLHIYHTLANVTSSSLKYMILFMMMYDRYMHLSFDKNNMKEYNFICHVSSFLHYFPSNCL
jgi:hypothetical protein